MELFPSSIPRFGGIKFKIRRHPHIWHMPVFLWKVNDIFWFISLSRVLKRIIIYKNCRKLVLVSLFCRKYVLSLISTISQFSFIVIFLLYLLSSLWVFFRALAIDVAKSKSSNSKCYGDNYFKERTTPRNARPLHGLIRFSKELESFACDASFIRGIEKVTINGTDLLWVCGSFASFSKVGRDCRFRCYEFPNDGIETFD